MSGQFQDPVALSPGKASPSLIEQEDWLAPQWLCTFVEEENLLPVLAIETRFLGSHYRSLVTIPSKLSRFLLGTNY